MIHYKKINHPRYKYELTERYSRKSLVFDLNECKYFTFNRYFLTIKPGYFWDGCTGAPDLKSTMRASLVHDVFYQCFREGWLDPKQYRKYADHIFRQIMIDDGASRFIARCYWLAVRMFGRWSAKADPKKYNPKK